MTSRRGFFKTVGVLLAGAAVKLPAPPVTAAPVAEAVVGTVTEAAAPAVPILFGGPNTALWGDLALKWYGGYKLNWDVGPWSPGDDMFDFESGDLRDDDDDDQEPGDDDNFDEYEY